MKDVHILINESQEFRQSHLDLQEECLERGGNSTCHKGILAQYLDTTIPAKGVDLCHACHNGACSNPKHLYWGTRSENIKDAQNNGTWKSGWDRMVEKYGYEEARNINAKNADPAKGGAGNLGKAKTKNHKKKIAESVKKYYNTLNK